MIEALRTSVRDGDVTMVARVVEDALTRGAAPESIAAEGLIPLLREAEGSYAEGLLSLPEFLAFARGVESGLEVVFLLLAPQAVARTITQATVERTVAEVRSAYLGRRQV